MDPGELRCVIGPNGAGKTTMMDVITGKTRPDHGSAWFGQIRRSADAHRAADRAGRHRAQVSEAERVRVADRLRESGALARRRQIVLEDAARPPDARPAPPHRRSARGDRTRLRAQCPGGHALTWTETVAGDRDAADAAAGAAAGGRAGRRNDSAGDRAHRGAAPLPRRRSLGDRRGARHGLRAVDRETGHRAARRPRAGGRRHGPRAEPSPRDRGVSRSHDRP